MPNYCENNLLIEGKHEKVTEVLELLKGDDNEVTFEKILPIPKDVENCREWCLENYDTKWNGGCDSYFFDDTVSFYTAWSPPLVFFERTSKQFSELTFTLVYFEAGCDFCGISIFKNGSRIYEDSDTCDSKLARELFGEEYINEYYSDENY